MRSIVVLEHGHALRFTKLFLVAYSTDNPYLDARPLFGRHPARDARIPDTLLGKRHPEWRVDRCGKGDSASLVWRVSQVDWRVLRVTEFSFGSF